MVGRNMDCVRYGMAIGSAALFLILAWPAAAQGMDGFTPVAPGDWPAGPSPHPVTLLEPLYRDHPETLEGRPTLDIHLRRGADRQLVVDVELGGLLDDATEALGYRAVVERGARGWIVVALGTRRRCARDGSGAWTTRRCP